MNKEHCIDVCNRLLRGERSAVESYDKAIRAFDLGAPPELTQIREEHVQAVAILEENVLAMGGEPEREAGAWGAFAKTVQGAANALGEKTAMESLQTGEKAGLRDYEIALKDEDVMAECKEMIRSTLLPQTEEHVSTLEELQRQEAA